MTSFQKGLTLIEVTVAAVIFSMIMLATVTAFRTFAGTYARLETVTARTTEMREAERFLRATLKSALNGPAYFEGDQTTLTWVAPLDRVGGVVGLQHLRLSEQSNQLMLSFAPVADSDSPPAWNRAAPPFPLISNLDKVRFFYQISSGDAWSGAATSDDPGRDSGLPRAVALEIVTDGKPWPPIVVQFDHHRPSI